MAQIWPQAAPDNWPRWYWVTQPGGPENFPAAVRAVAAGEHSIIRFQELRYALLPSKSALQTLLSGMDMSVLILLGWLRTDLRDALRRLSPLLDAALHWTMSSNTTAAAIASSRPVWWDDWVGQGLPAALQVVHWLEAASYPPAPVGTADAAAWRRQWLGKTLLPNYQRICANLLLAQSASGEHADDVLDLAEAEHLPAVRALELLSSPGERAFSVLKHLAEHGGRPLQAAANSALDGLARRQGLPNAEELARQHLLAAAWEQGPLAGERVCVGWQEGAYRLRLSLQAGKVATRGHRSIRSATQYSCRASPLRGLSRRPQRATGNSGSISPLPPAPGVAVADRRPVDAR